MKKIFALTLFILLSISTFCFAVDSVTVTGPGRAGGSVLVYTIRIVADGSGAVATSASNNIVTLEPGLILNADFFPDTGGTQPDNEYNVYLVDATTNGKDKLMNVGVDLPQAKTNKDNTRTPLTTDGGWVYVSGKYYIVADSMGADNATTLILSIKKSKN